MEEELEKLQNADNKQKLFLGTAFVTLSSQFELSNVLKNHRRNKLLLRILSFCNMLICRKQKNKSVELIESLDFDSAPEPNDIIWENFFYKFSIKKVLNTWIACSLLIGLSFIINFMLKSLSKNEAFKLSKINK